MLEFLRNLFAAIFGIVTWPFRMMFGGAARNNAAAHEAAEADETDSRLRAVQSAVAPDSKLEDALAVRRAARCVVRGEVPSAHDVDMPVRRWLHSLQPVQLAFVARAQPDALAQVMAGKATDACPVPPFIRSECDGSQFVAKLKSDLMAARAGQGSGPHATSQVRCAEQAAQPKPLPFGPSLTRTIRVAAANRP